MNVSVTANVTGWGPRPSTSSFLSSESLEIIDGEIFITPYGDSCEWSGYHVSIVQMNDVGFYIVNYTLAYNNKSYHATHGVKIRGE